MEFQFNPYSSTHYEAKKKGQIAFLCILYYYVCNAFIAHIPNKMWTHVNVYVWKMSVFQFVYRLNLIHNGTMYQHYCEVNGAYFVRLLLWSLCCTYYINIYVSFFLHDDLRIEKNPNIKNPIVDFFMGNT